MFGSMHVGKSCEKEGDSSEADNEETAFEDSGWRKGVVGEV